MTVSDVFMRMDKEQPVRIIRLDDGKIVHKGFSEDIPENCLNYSIHNIWCKNDKIFLFVY